MAKECENLDALDELSDAELDAEEEALIAETELNMSIGGWGEQNMESAAGLIDPSNPLKCPNSE